MENFSYCNPTRVEFGKEKEKNIGEYIKPILYRHVEKQELYEYKLEINKYIWSVIEKYIKLQPTSKVGGFQSNKTYYFKCYTSNTTDDACLLEFQANTDKSKILESLNISIMTYSKSIGNVSINYNNFNKDEILFYKGDEPKYLHLLIKGIAKLYTYDHKDNEVIIHNLMAPSLVAEIVNYEEMNFPANCSFETKAEVLLIDYEKFKKEFLLKPEISMFFINSLSNKNFAIFSKLFELIL
jgi:hypothetical protein